MTSVPKFYAKVMAHSNTVRNVSLVCFSCFMCGFTLFLTLASNVDILELQMQPSDDSDWLNVVRSTTWRQDHIAKDEYICSPLQNLVLYYPGNQEVN